MLKNGNLQEAPESRRDTGRTFIIFRVVNNLFGVNNDMKWISGATILGGGDPALILDIPRLIQHAQAS